MPLFPNRTTALRQIGNFPEEDANSLAFIWQTLSNRPLQDAICDVQPQVTTLLRHWKAYRNQPSPRNDSFLEELSHHQATLDALSVILNATRDTTNLTSILHHRESIELVYNFLKCHMLQGGIPARIVTVSKALLMVSGFSVGLDSFLRNRIKSSDSNMLTCSGVWPFCLYFETLNFVAREQAAWEHHSGLMSALQPAVPIGQLMDRILWRLE